MQTSTLQYSSIKFNEARTYLLATLFVAGNIILPQLCHMVPQGGLHWLPIYFFTLIGAYRYGWRVGVLTALASPVINSVLFGMPAVAMLPPIIVKSCLLAFFASFAARRAGGHATMSALIAVVVAYQAVGTVCECVMGATWHEALQDVRIGLPGLMTQILGGWLVLNLHQVKKQFGRFLKKW